MGSAPRAEFDDVVRCTILVSDLVDSTATAARLGDAAWHDLLDHHDRAAFAAVHGTRGRVVKTTGDGVLAVFSDAAAAVDAGLALRDAVLELGLHGRVGIHAGEIVRRGKDIGGLDVQIAARVCADAPADAVLVSDRVGTNDVSAGIVLEPMGVRDLKGVPGRRALARATRIAAA
jgi:class 3 adenylate cyclase